MHPQSFLRYVCSYSYSNTSAACVARPQRLRLPGLLHAVGKDALQFVPAVGHRRKVSVAAAAAPTDPGPAAVPAPRTI